MNRKKKKRVYIATAVVVVLLAILIGSLIFSSCSQNSKYEKIYDEAGRYFIAGDYKTAISSLEKALQIKETEEAYLMMAEVYMSMGDIDKAIEVLYKGSYKLESKAVNKRLEELKTLKLSGEDESGLSIGGEKLDLDATTLVLSNLGLTSKDIAPLQYMPKLQNLSLTDNNIVDISVLSSLSELSFLHLGGNSISDLTPLMGLSKLKTLYLDGNPIEDLTPLYSLKSLTTLSLKEMELKPEDVEQLKKALPDCGIFHDDMEEEVKELSLGGVKFMSDVTELDLGGLGISDIKVLSECKKLTKLDLRNNKISDITPLMEIPELSWLCLWNNKVTDIRPLMGMTKLTYLDVDNNNITDISAISALTNMEELWLSHNPIKSITPVSRLTNLSRLGLKDTGLKDSDLEELMKISNLTELALEDNMDISGEKVDAIKKALPKCTITHSDLLYSAQLGSKTYKSDAVEINESNSGISDITALEKFAELKALILKNNSISAISALTNLKNIEVLELEGNKIEDIKPLKDHTKLRILNLMNNKIEDISVISGCTSLSELHLSGNNLSGISALSGLTSLKELSLDYTGITDIGGLANLKNLEYLGLEGNSISDITALKQLTNLRTLYIGNNKLSEAQIRELMEALPLCSIYSDIEVSDILTGMQGGEGEGTVVINGVQNEIIYCY